MTRKWVVDASVAAKWLVPEADSAVAVSVLDDQLLAPELLCAELANLLWKKQARSEMDAVTAGLAYRSLSYAPLTLYACSELAQDALQCAIELRHPAYDCFYLALSARENCTVLTADRRFAELVERAPALRGRILLLSDLNAAARK